MGNENQTPTTTGPETTTGAATTTVEGRELLTVSRIAGVIDKALRQLGDGWVEGEVQDFRGVHASGHAYFSLADESAKLSICIWKGRLGNCQPLPKNGDLVQAHFERASFYAPSGKTSLIVDRLKATGDGELLRRREETLRRLRADGLCDPERRKPLPAFPRRIGVIAGPDAHIDVVRHIQERFPPQEIVYCPARVEGVEAVGSMIDALGRLQDAAQVDVIILARGGGSVSALAPMDDERLCRAIFACSVPVVSSIAHTKDNPNCDHVAAAFSHVPAKAAELAVRHSAAELLAELARHSELIDGVPEKVRTLEAEVAALWSEVRPRERVRAASADVEARGQLVGVRARQVLNHRRLEFGDLANDLLDAGRALPTQAWLEPLAASLDASGSRIAGTTRDYGRAFDRIAGDLRREVARRVKSATSQVQEHGAELRPALERALRRRSEQVAQLGSLVEAKDFRRRGWVMATRQDQAVTSAAELERGDHLRLRFADGEAQANITTIDQGRQDEPDSSHNGND